MSSVDVFAALRPGTVSVGCMERQWQLYPDTAYQWLGVMAFDLDSLTGVAPGAILDSDVEAMFRLALSRPDADQRWLNAARVAIARAGGRDWWWTVNLTRKLLQGWPYFNGRLLLSNVDARTTPLPDFLDAAYMLLWSNSDEQGRMKLDIELQTPPRGVPVRRSKQQRAVMEAAFAAD